MISDPDHAKLDALAERLRQADHVASQPEALGRDAPPASTPTASRIGMDFIGAVLGGALLGWLVDRAIPSLAPWAMIGMIVLGFGVGILSVWRGLIAPEQKQ